MANELGPPKKKECPQPTFRSPQAKVAVPIPANVTSPVESSAASGSPAARGVGLMVAAEADAAPPAR